MIFALLFPFVPMLIVPAALLVWLWRRRSKTKLDWLLRLAVAATYVIGIVLMGHWSMMSLHLRWVLIATLTLAAVISFGHAREAPFYTRNGVWWWLSLGGRVLLVAVFGLTILLALQARTYAGEALAVAAPLRGGRYVVGNGGSNPVLNLHNEVRPQTYALDIFQVNALGVRARGVLPRQLERYAIYGDTLYSPVSGTVAFAVDGQPDLTPPESDRKQLAGNHVWIQSGNAYLLLAHLKKGSVRVRSGQTVSAGEPIGQVGNSGNTSEPHLHIHAVRLEGEVSPDRLLRFGDPIPLLIEGRFLIRNSTF
jgi:hypothetical protein